MPAKRGATAENLSKSAIRRQRERESRYQTILAAAEKLFAREGYTQTSMEQIADAAEVSVGAVYFYFKNKEDLLVHLMDEIGPLLRSIIGNAFKTHGENIEAFKRAGHAFFEDFCINYPEKCAIIFRESVGKSPDVEQHRKTIFDQCIRDVLSALERVCRHHGMAYTGKFSPEVVAVSIMGIYERVAYQYVMWQDQAENLKKIGRDAVEFILGGVDKLFAGVSR
jgi:AcrR family transcriptional regulator